MKEGTKLAESRAAQISLQDFTEATFSSVMRAIDVRNQGVEDQFKIRGPIIYGIWFDLPEVLKGGQPGGPSFSGPE